MVHVSFLWHYRVSKQRRERMVEDVLLNVQEESRGEYCAMPREDLSGKDTDDEEHAATVKAIRGLSKKQRIEDILHFLHHAKGRHFMERRQRRARSSVGRYDLQYEVELLDGPLSGAVCWCTRSEFEALWTD